MDLGLRMRSSLWMSDEVKLLMRFMKFQSYLIHWIVLLLLSLGLFCKLFFLLLVWFICKNCQFFPAFIIFFSFLRLNVVSFLVHELIVYIFISWLTNRVLNLKLIFSIIWFIIFDFASSTSKIFKLY